MYEKETINDIYFKWDLFALDTWERSTMKILTEMAYLISSTTKLRHTETSLLNRLHLGTRTNIQHRF